MRYVVVTLLGGLLIASVAVVITESNIADIRKLEARVTCLEEGHEECAYRWSEDEWSIRCKRCDKCRVVSRQSLTAEDCRIIERWCGLQPDKEHFAVENADSRPEKE